MQKEAEELAQAKKDFKKEKDEAWGEVQSSVKHVRKLVIELKEHVASANSRWVWKAGTIMSSLKLGVMSIHPFYFFASASALRFAAAASPLS